MACRCNWKGISRQWIYIHHCQIETKHGRETEFQAKSYRNQGIESIKIRRNLWTQRAAWAAWAACELFLRLYIFINFVSKHAILIQTNIYVSMCVLLYQSALVCMCVLGVCVGGGGGGGATNGGRRQNLFIIQILWKCCCTYIHHSILVIHIAKYWYVKCESIPYFKG